MSYILKKYSVYFLFVFILLCISCQEKKAVSRTEFVIGTICSIKIPESESSDRILNECFSELKNLELILSANDENSELSKVNNYACDRPIKVSSELYELIKLSKKIAVQTNEAFNPAIGQLVKLWNIGFDNAKVPEKNEIKNALTFTSVDNIELKGESEVFLKNRNTKIDLGAIAKGYLADKLVRLLKDKNVKSAIIDLGGNVFVLGKKFFTSNNWKVGLRDPKADSNDVFLSLELSNTSVVTSGIYERFFIKDGIRYHHVLDSKTGYPVKNNLVSVSVICESSTYADALATAFLVMGYEKSLNFLKNFSDQKLDVVFIFDDGTYKTTNEALILH